MADPSCRITVHVRARASSNEMVGFDAQKRLVIRVTAPPVDGRANTAVIKLLADCLGVSKGSVKVVTGPSSRTKIVEVAGLAESQLRRQLLCVLER